MTGLFSVAFLSLGWRVCWRGMVWTFLKSSSNYVFRIVSLDEEFNYLLCFFFEVCVVRTQATKSQELRRRDAIFHARIVRRTVVQVWVGISCFVMDRCCSFSLFQGNVHVQKCNWLFRDVVRELNCRMDVLHKLNEVQKLTVTHWCCTNAITDISFMSRALVCCSFGAVFIQSVP